MKKKVTSWERVKIALSHKESDRIPLDIGSTGATGIHINTFKRFLKRIGQTKSNVKIGDITQQLALLDDDILHFFGVDTRGIRRRAGSAWKPEVKESENDTFFIDEWGIGWKKPKEYGFYYDMYQHPLKNITTMEDINCYDWPNPEDSSRFKGIKEKASEIYSKQKCAVVVPSLCIGFIEMSWALRGFENFFTDLAMNPRIACSLMDKIIELKMIYWEKVLEILQDRVLVVREGDDLGTQNTGLISPSMYRKYIKPRQRRLFGFIKKKAKAPVFLYFHSCGAIYDFIPDLIEVGVDILNPVQVSARGMDTKRLKKAFGKDLTFWGGGGGYAKNTSLWNGKRS